MSSSQHEHTRHSPLGARLAEEFGVLTPPRSSSEGPTVWSGSKAGARLAIHVLAEGSPQTLSQRYHNFQQRAWPFLPRLEGIFSEAGHTVIAEEWLEGTRWPAIDCQPERARELGAELFDILDEVHSAGLTCGPTRADQLLLDVNSRLRLLGVVARQTFEEDSPAEDRAAALRLLDPYLLPEERAECVACQTAAQVSRILRRGKGLRSDGEPALVGRQSALKVLTEALTESHLITVEAPAGGGKTRLLREWTRGLQARVLWTKAEREVAPSPFQMFAAPIAALEQELAGRPDLATLLVHELGVELPLMQSLSGRRSHLGSAAQAGDYPDRGDSEPDRGLLTGEQSSPGLQRGVLVMLSLVLTVIGRDCPTILVLDDCQWADPLTLRFLEYWAESGEALLVVASFRGEEVEADHPLRRLAAKSLILSPLNHEQARQLLLSREPRASATLLESAITQARGNPFSLLSYVRGGKLQGDSDLARYSALPDSVRKALGAASVLGREFALQDLHGCLEAPVDLAEARAEGLIDLCNQDRLAYRFPHDRVRDMVIASLHSDELSEHHLRAARYLSRQPGGNPFDVAFHFQAAGAVKEGFPHSLEAARLALEEHDSGTAIFYLRAALAGAEGQTAEAREELLGKLGDCYRLTGHYAEALDCFSKAFLLSHTEASRASLMLRIGDVHFKRGELELARSSVERGLALLGERLPKRLVADFLKQASIQLAHTVLPNRFVGRRSATLETSDLLRVDLYNRLAYIRWFLDGPIPSICAHLRELNLAERYLPSRSLARARATHAIAMGAFPNWTRALRFGASALQMARTLGDDWCEGQAGHFYGAALLGASQLAQSRTQLEAAVKKLQQTGDRWEENGARYHLALVYYHLGQLEQAAELARETQAIGVALDDRLAAGDNLFTWARASGGVLPRRALELEKKHANPDIQRACELLAAEALMEMREGRYQPAQELLGQAIALYKARRAQSMYSASLPCWLLTALRLGAQSQSGAERRCRLERANKALKPALRLAKRYRTNLPHTLREQALLLALEGKQQAAEIALAQSMRIASELGMAAELEIGQRVTSHWSNCARPAVSDGHDWMLVGQRP